MSSAYPPPASQLIRRCFRCGTPLPPNGAVCGSCGAFNTLPHNGWGQVQAVYGQVPVPVPGLPQAQAPATGSLWGYASNAAMPAAFVSHDYFEVEKKKRGPGRIGLMILIGLLLVLVIGGALSGVLYYSSHDQSAPAATPTFVVKTPSIEPLFRDTFTNNNTGWLVTTGQGKFSAKVGGGLMTLEDDDNKLLWDILPAKTFSDFRLDVDARLTKGDLDNAYGVYIRGASTASSDIGTYYRLELYGDGTFAIFKGIQDSNGNTESNRVTYLPNAAIHKEGQSNHITIIATGGTMDFIVNGVTIYTYSDTSYRGGLIAMFVSNLPGLAPGAQATFANLAIFPAS